MKKGQFAMKKITATFLGLSMIFVLTACGSQNSGNSTADAPSGSENDRISTETSAEILAEESAQYPTEEPIEVPIETVTEETSGDTETIEGKILVVYFSATGNTEEAANYIAAGTGDWLEGMRFSSGVSEEDVRVWVDSLGL